MAAFGAQFPCFAPFATEETDTTMPTYSPGVTIGELVSANLTITLANGEIWGDDKKIENVNEFASGAIPMETVDMLDSVAEVVYGATVADGEVHYKSTDAAPYGGLAYYKSLIRGSKKYYKGYFFPKVQAAVGNDNAQTKGSSITFQTTTTNFTVMAPLFDEGAWMIQSTMETIAEAKAWVKEKLNMAG